MKKALFVLSLLVVAPMKSSNTASAKTTSATPTEKGNTTPTEKGIFAKGCEKVSNGVSAVTNGTVNSVVAFKDGVFYVYDKVTGTVERFTPNMILSARDSVRNLIASYPLTAVALTAYITVKASEYCSDITFKDALEYFSLTSGDASEDDSF